MKRLREGTTIYVSGPFNSENIQEAKKLMSQVASILRNKNMVPITPFDNGLPEGTSWKQHVAFNLNRLILDCHAIVMLPEWTSSAASRLEHNVARESRLRLLYYIDGKVMYNQLIEL